MSDYYFYIIESLRGRAGFGITSVPHERNKQYTAHAGDRVKFKYLYHGLRAHAKALERILKVQFVDQLWKVGDWETEWLDELTAEQLKDIVDTLISERHIRVSLIATDFDFESPGLG